MYICNYFHLHFTKEGSEEQYLSHLHIIQSLDREPSLNVLTPVQPVIIRQERWFSFQSNTNKSLELAGWGANTGLKMRVEIQDPRNSIMLCFSVFCWSKPQKEVKSKKGSFSDPGCLHAAVSQLLRSRKEFFVVIFFISKF